MPLWKDREDAFPRGTHGMRLMIQINNKNDNCSQSCLLTRRVTVASFGLYVGVLKSIW